MPNDAKLGLIVGVGVVIAISVVFFRKEPGPSTPVTGEPAAAAVGAARTVPVTPTHSLNRPVEAKRTGRAGETADKGRSTGRRHLVQEGETLSGLAEQYYGDREKSVAIYRANRERLKTPDRLAAGTELVIPDVPEAPTEEPTKP